VLSLQVLHYQEGEQYVEHWDYFHDTVNVKNGGQRTATALIYLSEVDQGAAGYECMLLASRGTVFEGLQLSSSCESSRQAAESVSVRASL
jgi:hypothetical protein